MSLVDFAESLIAIKPTPTQILKDATRGYQAAYRRAEHYYLELAKKAPTQQIKEKCEEEAIGAVIDRASRDIKCGETVNITEAFGDLVRQHPELSYTISRFVAQMGTSIMSNIHPFAHFRPTPLLGTWMRTTFESKRAGS